jgi:hypothetical protein
MLTGQRDLGGRAGRPLVRFGYIWVGVLGQGVPVVDPRTLDIAERLSGEPEPADAGYGSTWLAHVETGEVVRFSGTTKAVQATIPVSGSSFPDHPCLTSIAAGAGGVWVTVVPPAYMDDEFRRRVARC